MNKIWQYSIPDICGMGLHFQMDGFQLVYAVITTFMWLEALLFSKEYMSRSKKKSRYYFFTIVTYIATMGVFLSADLYTTFIFFEIMSFTSYVWVAQDEKKDSLRAAATYLAVAIIGGMVMLMGIFLLYDLAGTLNIDELYAACKPYVGSSRLYITGICILFGFGAKAGAFPLHIWLPKAHPVAPAPASALLSGVLTKTGVFGILVLTSRIFMEDKIWGTLILALGVITMAGGAILALCSVDLKRTLACSSMSQIGFILVAVGMQGLLGEDNLLAVWGSVLHMVNHSLIKSALFMAAGVVYLNVHKLDLNSIRGFGRKKKLLMFIFLMGALGITGVPLWNGYVSKTLIHESIVEYIHRLILSSLYIDSYGISVMRIVEWIFLLCGGLTAAYMLKLFIAVFVEKNADIKKQEEFDRNKNYMKPLSAVCLTLSAIILPVMGFFPKKIMQNIAILAQGFLGNHHEPLEIAYFSWVNLKGAFISIAIGVLVYIFVVKKFMIKDGEYIDVWPKVIDLENTVYRPVLLTVLPVFFTTVCRVMDRVTDGIIVFLRRSIFKDSPLPHELAEGNAITHLIGHGLDRVIHFLNNTLWIDNKKEENMEHRITLFYNMVSENNTIIGRSLSFGLILSLMGLVAVLIYLLVQI